MGKAEDIIKSMDDEELKILLLCFSKPKVVEALRIYHTIPGFLKSSFINPGKKELAQRGITIPMLDHQRNRLLIGRHRK